VSFSLRRLLLIVLSVLKSYLFIASSIADAAHVLQSAREDGYDYITTVLPHTQEPRSDVTALTGRWWRTSVVGVVPQTSNPETLFERLSPQLEWAIHMGIPAIILPAPPSDMIMEYGRVLQSLALEAQSSNIQFWVKTVLNEKSLEQYDLLHRLCDGLPNIAMMLVIDPIPTMNSPAATVASHIVLLHKAIGAHLKAVCFPTKIFLTNKRGYPTLSKPHQVLFTEALKRIGRTVRIMVEGPAAHEFGTAGEGAGATNCLPYLQYIRHIRQRPECIAALDSEEAAMEHAYLDSLQRPLQPLKDHLEFSMYETFEKDPVKYAKYQEAIYFALKDGTSSIEPNLTSPKMITIAVAGAGRGPLVMRAIRAFHQLEAPPNSLVLNVFAVEKNPSAVVYLESMARHNAEWKDVVTVIHTDARKLTLAQLGGKKIDIVVSELLGSFGDNELSPECLDPLLASECCQSSTISIPMQYTTFLAPVSSIRLHTDAKQQAQVPHEGAQTLGLQRAMETSYVVRTHAASQTHPEQLCWSFQHPAIDQRKERAASLEFAPDPTCAAAAGCGYGPLDPAIASIVGQAPAASAGAVTLHGLLGFFTAVLYASPHGNAYCELSIAPHRFSENMFSWFPLYFPIREPLHVPAGSNVSVKMWRKNTEGRVWYEWCATVHRKGEIIAATPIHNPNGRSSNVSM
jgi:protein arginine N-methyltransferase 5